MKSASCVLTIAGSDSGGGAGVQADARTIQALGGYALTALTAITAQNTQGISTWAPVTPALLRAQIATVMGDFRVAAIKTGLLPGANAIREVARAVALRPDLPLVIDPVIGSTSGTRFLSPAAITVLKTQLLPRATIVTPNWPEAAVLANCVIETFPEAEIAARKIAQSAGCAVLVKGGHGPGATCRDCLVLPDGKVRWFSSPRVATPNTHGTGCVLSAAIATELALGMSLTRGVTAARDFLHQQLERDRKRRWSRGGAGPAFSGLLR